MRARGRARAAALCLVVALVLELPNHLPRAPNISCRALRRELVRCGVPSRELHGGRNCFNQFPPPGALEPRGGARYRDGAGRVWHRAPLWASVFHRPWALAKFTSELDARGGTSELEAPLEHFHANGSVPVEHLRAGSFNYYDFRQGARGAWCHALADIFPIYWHWLGA